MDAQQIGESIAKAVSREYKGVDVDFGEVIGRREDGSVSVSVGGGTVAARAMASFDVGAAIGKQVMLVEKGGVVTIMGTMADVDNSHAFTDAVDKINQANAAIGQIQDSVDQAEQAADQAAQSAQQAASDASAASQKADQLAQKVSDVEVEVSGFDGRLDELSTSVSGAVSDAGEALSTATEAKQTADSISSTAQQAYENAEEALTQSSNAVQTAQQVQTTVAQDYLKKTDAASTYATQSSLTQTADAIRAEVEQDFEDASSTYATKTEVEQTADGITQTVAETYLSKKDAGATYASKTELTQTADGLQVSITEAAGAASAAQTTANSAQNAAGAAQSAADSAQSMAQSAASNADTAKTLATSAQQGVNTVQTYFDFDSDGLHVGKRATSAAGETYETAETLMGSDGTFGVYDADGTLLAVVRPNGFIFGSGRFGIGYNANSPNIMQIYSLTDGDDIKVYTDSDGQVMVYCNDNQPQYHGAMIVQRQYAGLFTGDGESDAAGSGAYAIVQTSDGVGYVGIYGDDLRIGQKSGASASVPMSQVSSRLSGDASHQYLTGGVTLMTHPCGAVCLAVNAVAFPALAQWGTKSLGTVPAAYRPPVQVGCMGYFATSDGQVLGTVVVGTNGAVTFTAYNQCSAGQATCNLSWCV